MGFKEEATKRRMWNNSVGALDKTQECSQAARSFIRAMILKNLVMIEEYDTDVKLSAIETRRVQRDLDISNAG